MSSWMALQDLAEVLADQLFKGREDSHPASIEVATAIQELIELMIEEKTGAT